MNEIGWDKIFHKLLFLYNESLHTDNIDLHIPDDRRLFAEAVLDFVLFLNKTSKIVGQDIERQT